MLWVPCPKCKSAVCIEHWGEQTCLYEKCDGHKFKVEFNPETALLILEQIQRNNIQRESAPVIPMKRPSKPKLQKILSGHISVPQSDSENPDDWYVNDPFKI